MANSIDLQNSYLINRINDLELENQRLKELNSLFEQTNSAAKIGAWEIDLVNNKIFWSKVVREIHEVPDDYVPELNTAIAFFKDEKSNIDINKAVKDAIEMQKPYSVELILHTFKDNDVWVIAQGSPEIKDGKVIKLFGTFQNINDKKIAQEALAISENRFKGIFNSVFQFIGLLKPDGTLIEANETAMNFGGLKPKDVINRKFWDCYWWTINPKTQKELEENIARAAKGESLQYEVEVLGKNNTSIIILFSLKPLFDDKGNVFAIVPEGRPIQDIVDARKSLITKNKELEQFAYGASHDLKEPLRMIYSFMEIIKQKYAQQLDEKANRYIDFAVDGAKRMSILIDELLNYARVGSVEQEKETINVNQVINDIIKLQKAIIDDKKVKLEIAILPKITGIKTSIKQLLQNLISNAIKYQEENNPPYIKISGTENDTHWQFCIADNGIGIDESNFIQIFELFKRLHTREKYQGSGLGLAACKKIVEQHQGNIWLTSEEGKGSNFYFTIKKRNV